MEEEKRMASMQRVLKFLNLAFNNVLRLINLVSSYSLHFSRRRQPLAIYLNFTTLKKVGRILREN